MVAWGLFFGFEFNLKWGYVFVIIFSLILLSPCEKKNKSWYLNYAMICKLYIKWCRDLLANFQAELDL